MDYNSFGFFFLSSPPPPVLAEASRSRGGITEAVIEGEVWRSLKKMSTFLYLRISPHVGFFSLSSSTLSIEAFACTHNKLFGTACLVGVLRLSSRRHTRALHINCLWLYARDHVAHCTLGRLRSFLWCKLYENPNLAWIALIIAFITTLLTHMRAQASCLAAIFTTICMTLNRAI